jgi:hypothetical protein
MEWTCCSTGDNYMLKIQHSNSKINEKQNFFLSLCDSSLHGNKANLTLHSTTTDEIYCIRIPFKNIYQSASENLFPWLHIYLYPIFLPCGKNISVRSHWFLHLCSVSIACSKYVLNFNNVTGWSKYICFHYKNKTFTTLWIRVRQILITSPLIFQMHDTSVPAE